MDSNRDSHQEKLICIRIFDYKPDHSTKIAHNTVASNRAGGNKAQNEFRFRKFLGRMIKDFLVAKNRTKNILDSFPTSSGTELKSQRRKKKKNGKMIHSKQDEKNWKLGKNEEI